MLPWKGEILVGLGSCPIFVTLGAQLDDRYSGFERVVMYSPFFAMITWSVTFRSAWRGPSHSVSGKGDELNEWRSLQSIWPQNTSRSWYEGTEMSKLFKLLHRAVSFEKLNVPQLVKKFPAFYGTLSFITCSQQSATGLSCARCTQFTPSHPISLTLVLILTFHLRLDLPSSLFVSVFPIRILYAFLVSCVLRAPPILSPFTCSR